MKDLFTHLFSAPFFKGDEEKTWRASLLNAAIYTCVFVVLLVFAGNLIGGRTPTSVLIVDGVMVTVLFLIRRVLVSGRVSLAGALIISFGIGLITIAAASLGTIRTPTTAFLILIVIIAGLTHGKTGLLLSAAASSLAVLGLILAENAGLLPKPDTSVTVTQWISYTVVFGLTGMLTNYAYRSTQEALKRAFNEATERRRSQEAFENLVNYSLQAFVIIQDGKFVFANQEAERLSDYTREELYAMAPEKVFSIVLEEDREERQQALQNRLNGAELPSHVQFRINRKDGETRWLQSFTSVINYQGKPAIQAAYLDITEQKQAEEQLRKLERAVESAPVSVVITDQYGHIEYVNPFFSSTTGYDRDEVVGKNPKVLQSGNTPFETYSHLWETILGGENWRGEFINRKKNGALYIELALVAPILDTEGNITHFVAVKQDVTELKHMEDELRRREREYSSLVENTTDLIARFDTDLRYIYCNSEFERRGSRPISAYLGRTILEVNARKMESVIVLDKAARMVLETGEMQQVEHDLLTVSGFRHFQTRLFPEYDNEGRIVSIFSVGRDITEHKQLEDALIAAKNFAETLATVDELTGLYNRRGFLEVCRREVGRLQRYNRPLSVLFVDIDHFKQFNDCYSYEVGDQVLKSVAEILKKSVREIDVVGRYGGEEIVILLPEVDPKNAVETAERLRMKIERLRVSSDDGPLGVTASFGVTTLVPEYGKAIVTNEAEQAKLLEELIAKAGGALHFAKQQGRNRVVVNN